jgi:hypothetical protein
VGQERNFKMFKTGHQLHPPSHARQDAPLPNEAAADKNPKTYPLGYVEDFSEASTKLGTCFSIAINSGAR